MTDSAETHAAGHRQRQVGARLGRTAAAHRAAGPARGRGSGGRGPRCRRPADRTPGRRRGRRRRCPGCRSSIHSSDDTRRLPLAGEVRRAAPQHAHQRLVDVRDGRQRRRAQQQVPVLVLAARDRLVDQAQAARGARRAAAAGWSCAASPCGCAAGRRAVTWSVPASRGTSAPSKATQIAVVIELGVGLLRRLARSCAASLPGSQVSSSSQKATHSVSSARMPVLREPARPGVRPLAMTRTRRPGTLSASSDGSGVLRSKTTTTSSSASVSCARIERSVSRSSSGRSWVGHDHADGRTGHRVPPQVAVPGQQRRGQRRHEQPAAPGAAARARRRRGAARSVRCGSASGCRRRCATARAAPRRRRRSRASSDQRRPAKSASSASTAPRCGDEVLVAQQPRAACPGGPAGRRTGCGRPTARRTAGGE